MGGGRLSEVVTRRELTVFTKWSFMGGGHSQGVVVRRELTVTHLNLRAAS